MKTTSTNKIISTIAKRFLMTLVLALGINASANAQMFCQAAFTYTVGSAGQVSFTNASTGTNTNTAYYWNFGDNTTDNTQSPSHTYAYNGTYIVMLNIDSANGGCSSYVYDSVVINNSGVCSLVASLTYTNGASGLVDFTSTSTGTSGGMNYSWNFGDGHYGTSSLSSNTYIYNGTYGVSLTVSDPNGICTSTVYDSVVITNAAAAPTCSVSMSYTTGASGFASFSSNYSGTPATSHYYWNFGYQSNYANTANATFTYPYNGTYTVTLTVVDSANNCYATATDTININNTINQPCAPTVSFNMVKDSINTLSSTWYVYPNYSSQVSNAVWNWGDGTSSAGLYPSHNYATAGWYSICVTVYATCGDSSSICQNDSVYRASSMIAINVVNSTNGIKSIVSELNSAKAYPNPFTDNLTINVNSVNGSPATYVITDIYGSVIATENISLSKGDNKIGINTSAFSSGVYFITMKDKANNTSKTLKVVK